MDKVIEEFENVLVLQQPDGRIRFEAAHENSGTQLAMHDLYQEIMKLRAAEDEIGRLRDHSDRLERYKNELAYELAELYSTRQ